MTAELQHEEPNQGVNYVRDAWNILAEGAPNVAASLVNVAVNGRSEVARVAAAQAVLDRVGLPAKVDVGITATHLVGIVADTSGASQSPKVIERLAQIRAAQLAAAADHAAKGDTTDAVIVQFPTVISGEVEQ